MPKSNRSLWLIVLISLPIDAAIFCFMVQYLAATPAQTYYYLLQESPPRLLELEATSPNSTRYFDLPLASLGNIGPEGLAFVPNEAVIDQGLLGLEPSSHGGYFLVALQENGVIQVIEVPLTDGSGGLGQTVQQISVPDLRADASALFYENGQLWVASSDQNNLYRLSSAEAAMRGLFDLDLLDPSLDDVEALARLGDSTVILGDDTQQQVVRYDNFPACLRDPSCQPAWVLDVAPAEPSGLAWDAASQRLLMADDRGNLFSLTADGEQLTNIFVRDADFEGVTVRHQPAQSGWAWLMGLLGR